MSASKTHRRGPIAWMAGHSVTANLLMLVLLVGGLMLATRIKQEVFPDFDLDLVTITVAYPGASPEEVERGIVLAVEEAVQGLEGVAEVTSVAGEGRASVTVEMIEGENIQKLAQDIRNEVDRITSFPDDAEEPQVTVAARRRYVVSLALYGDQTERVLREYAELLRDRLIQNPEITQVGLTGVRDYEIAIEISQDALRTYGITLEEVAARVRRASVELPAGAVKTPGGDVLVRMNERRDFGREFGQIPIITAPDGTEVLLEDIAVIDDGFEETDRTATYNGYRAVMLEVYRVGDQTPISVSDAVKAAVADFNPALPSGLSVDLQSDRSDIYRQRLGLLVKNGYFGLGLVFILLALFLEIRLAFWVSLGIPISFLGGFFILSPLGVSINMVSMFAFIVSLGIVVDDAIVVGENIYHHHQQGASLPRAAVIGAREITMPVTFSVMTNMVAFMPLFFVPGFMGKVFSQIPLVVISVLAISLVESLLILPGHIAHQRFSFNRGVLGWISRGQQRFGRRFLRFVDTVYGPFLDRCLRWRYAVFAAAVALLILTLGYIQSGRLGFELFPKVESDFAQATATLPFGAAFARTEAVENRLVAAARTVAAENGGKDLVEGVFAQIDANVARVRVYLTPPDRRPLSTSRLTALWREKTGEIPGLESLRFESDVGGPGRGRALAVELSHRSMDVLEKASAELAEALSFYPNVTDIDDGFSPGKEQIDFKIRPEARSLGLRSRDVARQVRHAYYGVDVLRQQRGRNEVTVRVRLPRSERTTEQSLEEMILRTPGGREIPLREAVIPTRGRAYTDIVRRDGRRVVTVEAEVQPRSRAGEILKDARADILPDLQRKYSGLSFSFEGRQADQRESLSALFRGLLMALMVIFVMLAIPLNSYIQPAIIMTAIPFGIVGAAIGHLIMGYSLSVLSVFGIVALSGVVVNDSLVLIDFTNRKRQAGMSAHDAVHGAGIHRFRPILLTTLTTFGGLSPMIFETSRQARFLIPMALSLGFGVLFATTIILILVPCLYMVLEDLSGLRTRLGSDGRVPADGAESRI